MPSNLLISTCLKVRFGFVARAFNHRGLNALQSRINLTWERRFSRIEGARLEGGAYTDRKL
jgi:hypothetical protein